VEDTLSSDSRGTKLRGFDHGFSVAGDEQIAVTHRGTGALLIGRVSAFIGHSAAPFTAGALIVATGTTYRATNVTAAGKSFLRGTLTRKRKAKEA